LASAPNFATAPIAHHQRGQTNSAPAVRRKRSAAASQPPLWARAHALLGKTLLQLGRNQEAILALEAAVRLRPDYLLGRLHLARAYRKVGRLEDAKKEAEIVKELERRQHEPVPSLRRQSGS
jgi:tetratricopeptide (TPR) repeat protein